MSTFKPKISKSSFEEEINKILLQEGNDGRIVNKVKTELRKFDENSFFDSFWKVCHEYEIRKRFEITSAEDGDRLFRILLKKDGREWFRLDYEDPTIDVSILLAEKSYELLAIEIKNRLFFEENL